VTEIRDAQPADLAPVADLDAALFGADRWSPATMAAEFAAIGESRAVVVAVAGTRPVGYAISLTVADVADLQRIGVARDAQRQGLGSRLLAVLVDRAVSAGCVRMVLEVDARNEPASTFYLRHGFAEVARRSRYYPDGSDAIVMARELARQAGRGSGNPDPGA